MAEPTRRRKIVFGACTLLALYLVFELMSAAALYVIDGKLFLPARARAERQAIGRQAERRNNNIAGRALADEQKAFLDPSGGSDDDEAPEVVHPFLGYVRDPTFEGARYEINSLGFFDTPPPEGDSQVLTLGIFGGSVAVGLSRSGRKSLIEALEASPVFRGKEIWVKSFALGGYKQPQQLIALNYSLALGEKLDIVVNLDGFNDIALAPREYEDTGLYPFYPRRWPRRVASMPNVESQRLVGEIAYLEGKRVDRAGWCSAVPLRLSPSCHLAWRLVEARTRMRLPGLRKALAAQRSEKREYLTRGPRAEYHTETEMLEELSELWGRSSLQMDQICAAQSIHYFHFLQPNQYFPGSKIFGREEEKRAIEPEHPWVHIVPRGYAMLGEAGERLTESGVAFYDLRMLFAGMEEPMYSDSCCHFNRRGMHLLATAIGRAIVERHSPDRWR